MLQKIKKGRVKYFTVIIQNNRVFILQTSDGSFLGGAWCIRWLAIRWKLSIVHRINNMSYNILYHILLSNADEHLLFSSCMVFWVNGRVTTVLTDDECLMSKVMACGRRIVILTRKRLLFKQTAGRMISLAK